MYGNSVGVTEGDSVFVGDPIEVGFIVNVSSGTAVSVEIGESSITGVGVAGETITVSETKSFVGVAIPSGIR